MSEQRGAGNERSRRPVARLLLLHAAVLAGVFVPAFLLLLTSGIPFVWSAVAGISLQLAVLCVLTVRSSQRG